MCVSEWMSVCVCEWVSVCVRVCVSEWVSEGGQASRRVNTQVTPVSAV